MNRIASPARRTSAEKASENISYVAEINGAVTAVASAGTRSVRRVYARVTETVVTLTLFRVGKNLPDEDRDDIASQVFGTPFLSRRKKRLSKLPIPRKNLSCQPLKSPS